MLGCIDSGIVTGDNVVSDGSFIQGNVSEKSKIETTTIVSQSTINYLDALDKELSKLPGYREPVSTKTEKMLVKSTTDPDCGYIHQERKKGLGYLAEMTVDTAHGIITGFDCFPANQRESDIILRHVISQIKDTGISIDRNCIGCWIRCGRCSPRLRTAWDYGPIAVRVKCTTTHSRKASHTIQKMILFCVWKANVLIFSRYLQTIQSELLQNI